MALPATHIKFALDLKGDFGIKDVRKFVSGTVYPDSRYITKIDRDLTHNDDVAKNEFAKNDFKRGWQLHQVCDITQHYAFRKIIPLLDRHPHQPEKWPEDKWLDFAAAKIVQDMMLVKQFDLDSYLERLDYVINPNGEDVDQIRRFYKAVIDLYKGKKEITADGIYRFWLALGLGEKLGGKLKHRTEEFLLDNNLLNLMEQIYPEMLKSYKKHIL